MGPRPPASEAGAVGLGPRLAAGIVDAMVILLAWWAALFALVVVLLSLGRMDQAIVGGGDPMALATSPQGVAIGMISGGLLYAVSAFYLVYAWARLGATPGQQLAGLVVVGDGTRTPLSPGQATVRWFVLTMPVLGVPFGILLLAWLTLVAVTVARNPRHRGIHDQASGSIVVRRQAGSGTRPGGPPGTGGAADAANVDTEDDGTPGAQ